MQVILRENIDRLGVRGETVKVKDGYARNYLIPKKFAVQLTDGNIKQIELEKKGWAIKHQKEVAAANMIKDMIEKMTISVAKKSGENDTLFGSVTTQEIADVLAAEKIIVDKRKIDLPEPVKTIGTFPVTIKLHPEVSVDTKVWVVKE